MGRHGPLGHVSSLPGRLSPHLQGWLGLVVQCYISISFFGCAGSLLLRGLFSSCGERGLLSSCGQCSGFSLWWVLLVQSMGTRVSVVAAHGLNNCDSGAPEHRLTSCGTRD